MLGIVGFHPDTPKIYKDYLVLTFTENEEANRVTGVAAGHWILGYLYPDVDNYYLRGIFHLKDRSGSGRSNLEPNPDRQWRIAGSLFKSSSEYSILASFDREMTYLSPNEFK